MWTYPQGMPVLFTTNWALPKRESSLCLVLDANSHGPLNLLMHNTGERDYQVLKENPLAQLVIHRVAELPVHHAVLPSTFPKEDSKVSSSIDASGEYPNIIPPMPRKVRTPVSLRLYRLRSLELLENVPRVLFRDTDTSPSDSDGVLFPECSTPSSSGKCSDHSGELPDFEPDVQPINHYCDYQYAQSDTFTHSMGTW